MGKVITILGMVVAILFFVVDHPWDGIQPYLWMSLWIVLPILGMANDPPLENWLPSFGKLVTIFWRIGTLNRKVAKQGQAGLSKTSQDNMVPNYVKLCKICSNSKEPP